MKFLHSTWSVWRSLGLVPQVLILNACIPGVYKFKLYIDALIKVAKIIGAM